MPKVADDLRHCKTPQEARSEASATPAGSVYEMEHANGRHAPAEGRPSLASADSGGGGAPRTRGPERGMLKSPSSGSLSALARGGEHALRSRTTGTRNDVRLF
jgi:hypothetical protein